MDTAYYDKLWREKWGSANKNGNDAEAYWNGRADRFSAVAYQNDGAQRVTKLMDLFRHKGILNENASVLDIGCGPGKFAVEMAGICKEVIGIDISERMLAHAENAGQERKLDNLRFQKLDWKEVSLADFDWEKRFDLVFASMCPAINSQRALEKMIHASRGYCFMSHFAYRHESIRDRLAEQLLPEWNLHQQGNGIYCCFNILWLGDYYPEVTYMDSQWEHEFSYEEAVDYYSTALARPGGLSPQQRTFLESYLQQCCVDGIIREKVEAKFAWLYWKV